VNLAHEGPFSKAFSPIMGRVMDRLFPCKRNKMSANNSKDEHSTAENGTKVADNFDSSKVRFQEI
jgi:hypothetical protein